MTRQYTVGVLSALMLTGLILLIRMTSTNSGSYQIVQIPRHESNQISNNVSFSDLTETPLHLKNYSGEYGAGAAQAERQYKLRIACKQDNLPSIKMFCHPSEIIEEYQLIASFMPKCGGTNWNRLLFNIHGYHNKTESIEPRQVNQEAHQKFPWITKFNQTRQEYFLKHFKRIVFVRNPFVRLLSGFRDRLETYPNRYIAHRKAFNKKIYLQFGNHSKEERPGPSVPSELYNVTFREFVSFYLAGNDGDLHWREQYKICHPCLGYDYIGKVETYARDITEVLKFMGADPHFYPDNPLNPTNSGKDDTLARYYNTLSDDQMKKLVEKFAIDMMYFGYDVPENIRRPHIS